MSFEGKVILITGASSGIGAGTAVHFSKLGARLALTGKNIENLRKTADNCKKNSAVDPYIYQADLTNEKHVKHLVDSVVNHFKQLDVLVNNAGIFRTGSIESTSLDQYDNIFAINVRSVYHLTMLATPHLIKSKGNIVNISSVNGIRSFAGVLAYNMSKAALDQFTKSVAMELAPKGVRVNGVSPGVIETPIHKRAGMDDKTYSEYLEKAKNHHPLGRVGTTEDVAKVIEFLASDKASFTTGVTLSVDGGRHAFSPR